MDLDDLPRQKRDLLAELQKEDLEPFSLEALQERVVVLKAEIERAKAAMASKQGSRSEAEALFKKN